MQADEYYFENGLMVFTSTYHKRRGECCGSGCRHCPYSHAGVPRERRATLAPPIPFYPNMPGGNAAGEVERPSNGS